MENSYSCFVVEQFSEGNSENLHDVLKKKIDDSFKKPFLSDEIKRYIGCMLLSIYYLNFERKIYHRDLKAENFIICEKNGKKYLQLNDFGIPKYANEEYRNLSERNKDHTINIYMPPEYISRDTTYSYYGKYEKHDVWTIGVISFQLWGLRMPFSGKNILELGMNLVNKEHD